MATIYLIDDDRDFSAAVESVLQKAGHGVMMAAGIDTGLALIRRVTPDLLVLDVMMANPDDGIVLARQLRREGFSFPIVMLTAMGKVTGLAYGVDDELLPADAFLDKPVKPAALLATIDQLLAPVA